MYRISIAECLAGQETSTFCVETFPKGKYPPTNLTNNFMIVCRPILMKQNYSS